jgi:hypothetical protein
MHGLGCWRGRATTLLTLEIGLGLGLGLGPCWYSRYWLMMRARDHLVAQLATFLLAADG